MIKQLKKLFGKKVKVKDVLGTRMLMNAIKSENTTELKRMSKNEKEEECKKCKGKCCKICGCHFSPGDFEKISYTYLKNEIEKGYISISYASDEIAYMHARNGLYFLRIRNKGASIVDCGYWPMSHDGCIVLTETGCPFSEKTRPQGGLALNPDWGAVFNTTVRCETFYGIESCTKDWLPYQEILKALIETFEKSPNDYPCKL